MSLSGTTRLTGLLGWPVAHSRSPRLHGFWLRHHGIDGAYVPLPVRAEDFAAALAALPKLGFLGANVTVPHKETALALCDALAPSARRAGAVNTLHFAEGRMHGSNSDGFGFLESLRRAPGGFAAAAGPAVLLGAGGGARAIAAALLDEGVPELRLANRARARAEGLARDLGGPVRVVEWAGRAAALEGAALLVNATPLGMKGQPPLDLDLAALPRAATVIDIVYAPLETPLLAAARARGHRAVDGLGMLLHQARHGFKLWWGRDPEVTEALRRHVAADLIGEAGR